MSEDVLIQAQSNVQNEMNWWDRILSIWDSDYEIRLWAIEVRRLSELTQLTGENKNE